MKKYLVILSALAVFTSCKKSTVSPGLIGKWELRHSEGSILGFDSTFKAGNGRILQLRSDSSYARYDKGSLVIQGKFHVGATDFPVANSQAVYFDGNSSGEIMILNGDKLQLGMDFDDGIELDYQKISDQ